MSHQSPIHEALYRSPCINLRSFRKDGSPVDTPVWVAHAGGGRLGSYTDDRTHKVKRLRRNPEIEVAACDVWGRRTTGWYKARCKFVDAPEDRALFFGAIKRKYGIHWHLSLWGSLLTGRVKHRLVLEYEISSECVQP